MSRFVVDLPQRCHSQAFPSYACLVMAATTILMIIMTTAIEMTEASDVCPVTLDLPADLRRDDKFQYAEAGFQVFTDFEMPCAGVITAWWLRPRTEYILQLNLVLLRPVAPMQMLVVGTSYFDAIRVADIPLDSAGWVRLELKTPLVVAPGDVVGMYYDEYMISDGYKSVASKKLDEEMSAVDLLLRRPTYVKVYEDSKKFGLDAVISMADAFVEYRVPALMAHLEPFPDISLQTTPPPFEFETVTEMSWPAEHTTMAWETVPVFSPSTIPPTIGTTPLPPTRPRTYPTIPWRPPPTRPPPPPVNFDIVTVDLPPRTTAATPPDRCQAEATMALQCSHEERRMRAYFDASAGLCRAFPGCPATRPNMNNFASAWECHVACIQGKERSVDINSLIARRQWQQQMQQQQQRYQQQQQHHNRPSAPVPLMRTLPPISYAAVDQMYTTPAPPLIPLNPDCLATPSALEACSFKAYRYYFDIVKQRCVTFWGCSLGSDRGNNFATMKECSRCLIDVAPASATQERVSYLNNPIGLTQIAQQRRPVLKPVGGYQSQTGPTQQQLQVIPRPQAQGLPNQWQLTSNGMVPVRDGRYALYPKTIPKTKPSNSADGAVFLPREPGPLLANEPIYFAPVQGSRRVAKRQGGK